MKRVSFKQSGIFILLAFACAIIFVTPSVKGATGSKLSISSSFLPDTIRKGEFVTLSIKTEIPARHHLYPLTKAEGPGPKPLKITFEEPALESAGDWHGPTPKIEFDEGFQKDIEYFDGTVTHKKAFKVIKKPSGDEIDIVLKGQICNENACFNVKEKFKTAFKFEEGPPRAEYSTIPVLTGEVFHKQRKPPTSGGASDPTQEGLILFLLAAFIAGLGALATPCVFPMIPITVSFFSKFSKVSMRRTVVMASIYAISMILMFTLVGVLMTVLFGADSMQNIAAHPIFNAFLALLLIVFAFNLFGLFEIRVPSWLISRSAQKEQELTSDDGSFKSQASGVFFMAITFTLVSFTCTVAFIGSVLAMASQGEWFYPIVGMLTFSFAFALPFFFLAVFPSWAEKLKGKGGDWMVAVKVTLGFVEFAGAFKFLSNLDLYFKWGLLTRPFVLTFWTVLFGLSGMYLLRIFGLTHDDTSNRNVGPIRMGIAMLLLAIAAYSFTGITHQKAMGGWIDGWLPPVPYPGETSEDHLSFIQDDLDKAMAIAKAENKPLFIDFTGISCTNCRLMEMNMFPKPQVKSKLEKMVRLQAITDGPDEVHDMLREYQVNRFKDASLPFYAVINPHDDSELAHFASMTHDTEEYAAFLEKALNKFQSVSPAKAVDPTPEEQKIEEKADATPSDSSEPTVDNTEPASNTDGGVQSEHDSNKALNVDVLPVGEPLDFSFPTLKEGKTFKLSSLRGQWVLVNLWASWCVPCRKELLNDFPPALKTAPQIKLVTIAFEDEETKVEALKFAKDAKLFEHVALVGPDDAEDAKLPESFQADNSLPYTYLIDPKGRLAWRTKAGQGAIHKEDLIKLFKNVKSFTP